MVTRFQDLRSGDDEIQIEFTIPSTGTTDEVTVPVNISGWATKGFIDYPAMDNSGDELRLYHSPDGMTAEQTTAWASTDTSSGGVPIDIVSEFELRPYDTIGIEVNTSQSTDKSFTVVLRSP